MISLLANLLPLNYIFSLILLVLVGVIYAYYKQYTTIKHYEKQGVTIVPGAYRPMIGNLLEFAKYDAMMKQSEEPMAQTWLQFYGNIFDQKDSQYKP